MASEDEDRFPCESHPEFEREIDALAEKGFLYDVSIGSVLAIIDDKFVNPEERIDPVVNWTTMPRADEGRDAGLDLRCIDPVDGRITVIATMRGNVLFLASAGLASTRGRAAAASEAIKRVSNPDWCPRKS